MNYVLTKTNSKGQVVLPKKFRDELGIDENVLLNLMLSGRGIYVAPIDETVVSKDSKNLFIEILEKTAGSWAGDDWPETEKRRKKIELAASKRRKLW